MRKKAFRMLTGLFALALVSACGASIFANADNDDKQAALKEIPLFETTSSQSTVEYGAFEGAPLAEGVKVSLVEGDVLKYNRPLNISELTSGDSLVDICVVPDMIGEANMSSIQITLTDVYDSNNQMIIDIHDMTRQNSMSYAHAKTTGQPFVGFENGHTYWKNSNYGQWCYMSFLGNSVYAAVKGKPENNRVSLAYDYAEKKLKFLQFGNSSVFADFDDPNFYPTLWDGFTTGEVMLSVKCGLYSKERANFVMVGVMNHDLKSETFRDKEAPVIGIAKEEEIDEARIPNAVVGKAYPIFDTFVTDNFDGYLSSSARVYRNYYMTNRVAVTTNGKSFTPKEADTYYIEYRAEDSFGNVALKVVEVEAVVSTPELAVAFDTAATTGIVGEDNVLPEYTTSGGTGKLVATETVTVGGKEYPIYQDEVSLVKTFRPMEAGTYQFNVTLVDHVRQTKTVSYEIVVTASDAAVFIDPAVLPKYFIVGATYNLPVIPAYDFTSGTQKEVASKVYEVMDGNEKEIAGGVYTPTAAGSVTLVYKAMNGQTPSSVSYEAKVVDVSNGDGGIDLDKYFYLEAMTAEDTAAGTVLSVASGAGRAEFVNPLSIFTNSFEMSVPADAKGFLKFNVYYYNYFDASKYLKFTYENVGNGVLVYVNDEKATSRTLKWQFNGSGSEVKMNWNEKAFYPDSNTNVSIPLANYYNGAKIEFDLLKTKGYMVFEIEGATSASSVCIRSIAGQMMTTNVKDTQIPGVYLVYQQLGAFSINEEFVIKPALAIDVLDPTITSYVTVKGPDGNAIADVNGVTLDKVAVDQEYVIKLETYGVYRVIYYAEDGMKNANKTSGLILEVVDEEAPTLTLDGAVPSKIELGQSFYVPRATATDNVDAAEDILVFVHVIIPAGQIYDFSDGSYDGFKPLKAGKYIVKYTAMDSVGNMAMQIYEVQVVEPATQPVA